MQPTAAVKRLASTFWRFASDLGINDFFCNLESKIRQEPVKSRFRSLCLLQMGKNRDSETIESNENMKPRHKRILLILPLCLYALGVETSGAKMPSPLADKAVFSIFAFTLKTSDGKFEMKLDEQGKVHVAGKHVATANAKSEFNTPDGKLLIRVKENGKVISESMGTPVIVNRNGTLTIAGVSHSWVDGTFPNGGRTIPKSRQRSLHPSELLQSCFSWRQFGWLHNVSSPVTDPLENLFPPCH